MMNMSATAWKQAVLVPQADSMGAIAVVRSLGQHGYQVHAASVKADALGCHSAFVTMGHLCPSYDSAEYLTWLRATISQYQIAAIIPSEGFLLAIKHHFAEFAPLMPIPQDEQLVYGCLSKVYVFDLFLKSPDARLRQHISETAIITDIAQLELLNTEQWTAPFFVKGDGFYSKQGDAALVAKARDLNTARSKIAEALGDFDKILLQDCSHGVKATVNLLLQDGHILAESMAVASHENPHTGGLTALRQSWWHQPMYEDAVLRLQALGWNGPAMVEYKWDAATQTFDFIELNSRYWAALNLDILAGLHFPAIHLDYFFNKIKPAKPIRLTRIIRARHALPADFGYLLSKVRDPDVSKSAKLKSFLGFFLYFLHPGIYSDLNYPGDRKLAWLNTKAFMTELIRSCVNKLS